MEDHSRQIIPSLDFFTTMTTVTMNAATIRAEPLRTMTIEIKGHWVDNSSLLRAASAESKNLEESRLFVTISLWDRTNEKQIFVIIILNLCALRSLSLSSYPMSLVPS